MMTPVRTIVIIISFTVLHVLQHHSIKCKCSFSKYHQSLWLRDYMIMSKAINKLLLHHSLIASDYISIQMVKITKLVNNPSDPLLNNPTSQPVMCFG